MPLHAACPGVFVDRAVEAAPNLVGPEDGRSQSPAGLDQSAMRQCRVEGIQPVDSGDRRIRFAGRPRGQPTRQGVPAFVEPVDPFVDEGDLIFREQGLRDEKEPIVPVLRQLFLRQHRRHGPRRFTQTDCRSSQVAQTPLSAPQPANAALPACLYPLEGLWPAIESGMHWRWSGPPCLIASRVG